MPEPEVSSTPDDAASTLAWIDEIADRFEQAWRSGTPPKLGDFLTGVSGERYERLLVELLKIDLEHRWRLGERRSPEDYLWDYPDLLGPHQTLPPQLLEFGQRLRDQYEGPAVPAVESAPCPAVIGKYRVVDRLGSGGQATVYRAVHPTLGKDVAIKLSKYPVVVGPQERTELLAEGRILADLDHPHLARVHDFEFHEDRPFLVMEYVRGSTLRHYARQHSLSPKQVAILMARVARALAVVHARGIVHQDLKPQNILITEAGEPKILDFGLARLRHVWANEAGQPSGGTLAFMAGEQARGEVEHVGPRSDIFALGATLYSLLTGKAPFHGPDSSAVLDRARRCDFDRTALRRKRVPRRLEAICLRAMAKDPADRHGSADELAADLERFARRPRLLTTALAAVVALLLAGFGIWWQFIREKPASTPTPVDARLDIMVRRAGKDLALGHVERPYTGDKLVLRLRAPPDVRGGLFLVSSQGQMEFKKEIAAGHEELVTLVEPSGMVLILVCGSRSGPLREVEVLEAWDALAARARNDDAWTPPQKPCVLRLDRDKVEVVVGSRDVELMGSRNQPDEQALVMRRLDRLRLRLRDRFDFVTGVAFSHQAKPEEQ